MKKRSNRLFSLLELMVVVLVILTLLALTLPSVESLFLRSNTLLCQKNLKDIHGVIHSYSIDHFNVLPGYDEYDNPELRDSYIRENNKLYRYWNGHLLPYIDPEMNFESFERYTKLFKTGGWFGLDHKPVDASTPDMYIFENALKGEGPFRMFYCPEVTSNSIADPGVYNYTSTNAIIPKMFNLTGVSASVSASKKSGAFFQEKHSHAFGTPVCYTANDYMFKGSNDSSVTKKITKIKDYGKRGMLLEGGNSLGYFVQTPYFQASGDNINLSMLGFNMSENKQFSDVDSHFNFVHDNEGELWYSSDGYSFSGDDGEFNKEQFSQYNELYAPVAYTTPERDFWGLNTVSNQVGTLGLNGRTLITHEDPDKNPFYVDQIKEIFGWDWSLSFKYMAKDDIRLNPLTGSSNILFGDGTVKTKHVSWIFTNRMELFTDF